MADVADGRLWSDARPGAPFPTSRQRAGQAIRTRALLEGDTAALWGARQTARGGRVRRWRHFNRRFCDPRLGVAARASPSGSRRFPQRQAVVRDVDGTPRRAARFRRRVELTGRTPRRREGPSKLPPESVTIMFQPARSIWSILARGPVLYHALLTVAYVVSGKAALLLAVPPGFASPIFPPAGIAVAAVLAAGRPVLPWIFLGSLLLNLWTAAYSLDHGYRWVCLAAAAAIATASTLQAAFGGTALRRAIGYPTPLDNGPDLWRLLLLSPVFCLTSASLSLVGLFVLGQVRWSNLATNWIAWWTGD